MISKHSVRGRHQMAMVASFDAVLLSYVVLLMLLALDEFEGYDFLFLSLHMLHILSVMIAYVFVRHTTTSLDTLRILVLVYFILLIVDAVVCVGRLLLLGHQHDDESHKHLAALVKLVLALLFALVDVSGAMFAIMAQHSSAWLRWTNDELLWYDAKQQVGREANTGSK